MVCQATVRKLGISFIGCALLSEQKSYSLMLSASSIMGSATAITLILSIVRLKAAALLIGATGVGLSASFLAIQGLIGAVAGLGMQASAVRGIAAAVAANDDYAVARIVLTLRRVSLLTGVIGMTTMVFLSQILSTLTFGNSDNTIHIAVLGLAILFGNLYSAQMAVIQGMRRVGDMARVNVISSGLGTIASVVLFATMNMDGVIPSLLALSGLQLVLARYHARLVPVKAITLSIRDTFTEARGLVKLGVATMLNGFMESAVIFMTIVVITQQEGLQAVGLYNAAFLLSGMLVAFVLASMGADYYPRLAAASSSKVAMSTMVNHQVEIALLIGLPGLLVTASFAPYILETFYSREFLPATQLLQYFVLGCVVRLIALPLGFVTLAIGAASWFLVVATTFALAHVTLMLLFVNGIGTDGAAIAYLGAHIIYVISAYGLCRHLIGFRWSRGSKSLAAWTLAVMGVTTIAAKTLPSASASLVGASLLPAVCIYCLRGIIARAGTENKFVRTISRLPHLKNLLMS
jgi:enterobacterial common antigen flippase